jgi:hypothetical protein
LSALAHRGSQDRQRHGIVSISSQRLTGQAEALQPWSINSVILVYRIDIKVFENCIRILNSYCLKYSLPLALRMWIVSFGIFLSARGRRWIQLCVLFFHSKIIKQRGVTARVIITSFAPVVSGELSMQVYTKQGFISNPPDKDPVWRTAN